MNGFMEHYSVEQLWQNYKELKNIDFSEMPFEEIKNIFMQKFPAILSIGQKSNVSLTPKWTFYRAVINNEQDDLVDRISYNPTGKLNRANIEGFPVFYCSEHAPTSIREISPRQDDIIYLGIWSGNNLTKLPIIPYLTNYEGQLYYLRRLKEKIHEMLKSWEFFNTTYEYRKNYYEILTEFFLNDNFYLSSFIAHSLMQHNKQTEILIYPSIKRNRDFANFAIHKEVIDKKRLKLDNVIRFKFKDFHNIMYKTEIGVPIDNKITWGSVSKEEYESFTKSFLQ